MDLRELSNFEECFSYLEGSSVVRFQRDIADTVEKAKSEVRAEIAGKAEGKDNG